jgi:hypothetical protein
MSTRKVEIGGIARTPERFWMSQIARNLADADDGILAGKVTARSNALSLALRSHRHGEDEDLEEIHPRSPNHL